MRVRRLLAQAKALREAQEIRAYVSAVRDRQATLDDPLSEAEFQDWANWALSQADRIDPVLSGSFRTVQVDDFSTQFDRPITPTNVETYQPIK